MKVVALVLLCVAVASARSTLTLKQELRSLINQLEQVKRADETAPSNGIEGEPKFPGGLVIEILVHLQESLCMEDDKDATTKYNDMKTYLEGKLNIDDLPDFDAMLNNFWVAYLNEEGKDIEPMPQEAVPHILGYISTAFCHPESGLEHMYYGIKVGMASPSLDALIASYEADIEYLFNDDDESSAMKIAKAIGHVVCYKKNTDYLEKHMYEVQGLISFIITAATETPYGMAPNPYFMVRNLNMMMLYEKKSSVTKRSVDSGKTQLLRSLVTAIRELESQKRAESKKQEKPEKVETPEKPKDSSEKPEKSKDSCDDSKALDVDLKALAEWINAAVCAGDEPDLANLAKGLLVAFGGSAVEKPFADAVFENAAALGLGAPADIE